jgi:hypothetical protein
MKRYVAVGILCLLGVAIAVLGTHPDIWRPTPTGLKPDEAEMYMYASSCPTRQSFRFEGDRVGQALVVSLHECDATSKDAPKWLRSVVYRKQAFVIAERQGWFGKQIVAGDHSYNGYAEVRSVRVDGKDALFLVTPPDGSGGFVNWCLFGRTQTGFGCIQPPSDFEKQVTRHLQPGEMGDGWVPSYIDNSILLTEDVCGKDDFKCFSPRGSLKVLLEPKAGHLEPVMWRRTGWQLDGKKAFVFANNQANAKLVVWCYSSAAPPRVTVYPGARVEKAFSMGELSLRAPVIYRPDNEDQRYSLWYYSSGDSYRDAHGILQTGDGPELWSPDGNVIGTLTTAKRFYFAPRVSTSDVANLTAAEPKAGYLEFDVSGLGTAMQSMGCTSNSAKHWDSAE